MPIIKSAIKRVKQTAARRERNIATKRAIKYAVKAFEANPTAATLSAAHSEFDKAFKKGLLKKNTVARRKSSLSAKAKAAGVKLEVSKKAKTTTKKPVAKKATTKAVAAKTPAKKTAPKKPAAKKPAAKK